jgi:type IV secretory pathway VirB10-like protein
MQKSLADGRWATDCRKLAQALRSVVRPAGLIARTLMRARQHSSLAWATASAAVLTVGFLVWMIASPAEKREERSTPPAGVSPPPAVVVTPPISPPAAVSPPAGPVPQPKSERAPVSAPPSVSPLPRKDSSPSREPQRASPSTQSERDRHNATPVAPVAAPRVTSEDDAVRNALLKFLRPGWVPYLNLPAETNQQNLRILRSWMDAHGLENTPLSVFLDGANLAEKRSQAVKDLRIPLG